MKSILFTISLLIGLCSFADSMDEIRIHHNGIFIESVFINQTLELQISNVSIGDTITFEYSTDWGGEESSRMESKYGNSNVQPLKSVNNWGKFELIVTKDFIKEKIDINLHSRNQYVPVWHCFILSFEENMK